VKRALSAARFSAEKSFGNEIGFFPFAHTLHRVLDNDIPQAPYEEIDARLPTLPAGGEKETFFSRITTYRRDITIATHIGSE
jgi:hypothetical protein